MSKWIIVMAGISDLARPADVLSAEQAASLAILSAIACRFSVVIIPKNYTLLSVNVFVGVTQAVQLFRALSYQHKQGKLFQQDNKESLLKINVESQQG